MEEQPLWPLLIVFAVFAVMIFTINYNRFMRYRNRAEASWGHIDAALKRRFNLIPNLVRIVAQYQRHEAEVYEKTAQRFNPQTEALRERSLQESGLSRTLGSMLAVAEEYPELKSSSNFLALQQSVFETEKDIMLARDRFNDNVASYNTMIDAFPSNLIAKLFGFEKMEYFTLELATQREVPGMELQ